MFHLEISTVMAKALNASNGIPEQELTGLRTSMRRYVSDWLEERRRGSHAWSMDPYDHRAVAALKETVKRLKSRKFTTVVWVGIGGSGLGPRVMQEVFENPKTPEFIVLDTVDPATVETYLNVLDWKRTLIVVASKSGGTLESMTVFFLLWEKLQAACKGKAAEHVVAVTDPKEGALRDFCLQSDIEMLAIPPAVGGRYSIFTPIGLLPLALLDGNIENFLRGAKEMDDLCQSTTIEDNPAALLACVQYLLEMKRGYSVRVIMPYSQRLQSLARWNQQLIAESLGKTELHNPIPLAAIGTQDQHSLLQQWMAGPRKTWHLFIRDLEKPRVQLPEVLPGPFQSVAGKTLGQLLDAFYEGTSRALIAAKRPVATIALTRLDENHLGQLFFCLLAEVVFLGKLYRIDPYGQPAVEIGKQITKEILSRGRGEM